MAARQEKPKRETLSRFQVENGKCAVHLAKNSMFAMVLIKDEKFVDGMRVHLEFFLNVKSEGEGNNLQPLGSKTTATVQPDGKLVVVLAFGKHGSQETAFASFCGVLLPQRVVPPKGEHLCLELVCAMRQSENANSLQVADDTEDNWLGQVHLQLMTSWSEAVFAHSSNLFESNAKEELPDFLPIALVFRLMRIRWANATAVFHSADQAKHHDRKSRGKAIDEHQGDDNDDAAADDDEDTDTDRFPAFTKDCMLQMLRLVLSHSQWLQSDFPPKLISRHTFCGASMSSVDKGASLWSVFETLIELVGRSRFVRQLFSAGQLHFLTPEDVIELPLDLLTRARGIGGHPPLLCLFRISRSLSSAPAVVLEMLEIIGGSVQKLQPSPYVTADQIVSANGDIYEAFANLESVHHPKLVNLNPEFRLRQIESHDGEPRPLDSLSGRQVRCKAVGPTDALNLKLKENQDMSARLWWAMSAKPATASFQELTIRSPERTPPSTPDRFVHGFGTPNRDLPSTPDRFLHKEHHNDSLIESN